jgi:hypothetical protein
LTNALVFCKRDGYTSKTRAAVKCNACILIKENTHTFNRNDVNTQIGVMRTFDKEEINVYTFLPSLRENEVSTKAKLFYTCKS